jgi:DHA1 family tetracycline resistance protein-like MFS transporter
MGPDRDNDGGTSAGVAPAPVRTARGMTQLLVHSGVHWFALILRMSAENELWIRYYNGDFAAQAKTVGNTRSAASMLGFVLTPIFAGLTDAHGRKPVLLLASVGSVIKNVIVVLSPSARSLVISTALSTLTMSSWELASQSMVGDTFNAHDEGGTNGGASAAAGLGGALSRLQMMPSCMAIICPVIGGALAARDLRLPFVVQAVLCAVNSVALLTLPETHPKTARTKFSWKGSNPMRSLLRLFTKGAKLRYLAILQLVSDFTDIRAIFMISDIHRASSLGWSVMQRGKFMSFSSCVSIPGYFLAGSVIKLLGDTHSMVLGLLSSVVENLINGLATSSWHYYAGRPTGFFRPSAVAALNARITLEGTAQGLAQGELRGAVNNLMTIVQITSPVFWGYLYAAGVERGRPGFFYLVVSVAACLQVIAVPLLLGDAKPDTVAVANTRAGRVVGQHLTKQHVREHLDACRRAAANASQANAVAAASRNTHRTQSECAAGGAMLQSALRNHLAQHETKLLLATQLD